MAEKSSIDVLMQVVVTAQGLGMGSEDYTDATGFAPNDPLLQDFKPGRFCSLQSFGFAAGLARLIGKSDDDDENGKTPPTPSLAQPMTLRQTVGQMSLLAQNERMKKRQDKSVVDMQPVSYSRILDTASTDLFTALARSTTIAKISIVKRKAAGAANSGLGYLRLDFENVLMTSLEWMDGEHLLLENGVFIYRKVKITYKQQNPDGTLSTGSDGVWTMTPKRTGQ